MNDKFDELAKGLAQSVTRRGALKRFGLALAGSALALLGLTNKAVADPKSCLPRYSFCKHAKHCRAHCCSGEGYLDAGEFGPIWRCV